LAGRILKEKKMADKKNSKQRYTLIETFYKDKSKVMVLVPYKKRKKIIKQLINTRFTEFVKVWEQSELTKEITFSHYEIEKKEDHNGKNEDIANAI
jgi:hypothetical protein